MYIKKMEDILQKLLWINIDVRCHMKEQNIE